MKLHRTIMVGLVGALVFGCQDTKAPTGVDPELAKGGNPGKPGGGKGGGSVAIVEVTPATAEIVVGNTVQLTAVAKHRNGKIIPDVAFAWSSSDAAVATVDAATGLVTGVALGGPVTITATSSGKKGKTGSALVTVVPTFTAYFDEATFLAASEATLAVSYPEARALTNAPYTENGVTLAQATGYNNQISEFTPTIFTGNVFGVSGAENVDITFATPVSAFGLWLQDGLEVGFINWTPGLDSQFEFSFYAVGGALLGSLTLDPPVDQAYFVGFTFSSSVERVTVRELGATTALADPYCENDFFQKMWTK